MLSVDDVHAYYGDSHILKGMSFSLGIGRVATLLGRNGAGKTTMLRTINGIIFMVAVFAFRGGIMGLLGRTARLVRGHEDQV